MSKKLLFSLFLMILTTFTSLIASPGAPAVPGDNNIQGSVNLSTDPHTITWTIEAAFLSEISRTQNDEYLIDGQNTGIQDITDYLSREYTLPIPEAGELSYQVDGKIGAEPEIHIPVHTFNEAGTARISVYQHSQGSLQAVWLPGFLTFTVTFSPEDGQLPAGYTLPSAGNGRVPKAGMQNLQLPATQEQFEKEYAVFIDGWYQWADFFNTNLQSRQTKRITMHPGITGNNLAEKTVSWIGIKFSGADVQQLSSTIDKLKAQINEPYLASDVHTLLNWGALLIDKSGPFNAVITDTTEAVESLSKILTYYAYNTQVGEITDFNFEKNRILIKEILESLQK
ncbi:MAG: hypothetical protein HQ557_00915 [Bacteroidetes bacterium]|nr:hypothetical protein [Bacteroidota bacterium]